MALTAQPRPAARRILLAMLGLALIAAPGCGEDPSRLAGTVEVAPRKTAPAPGTQSPAAGPSSPKAPDR